MSPSADRPLWLLDIDGVINALARGRLSEVWPEHDWVQRLVFAEVPDRGPMSLPIAAARPVLNFVTDVHRSGRAEIRWHSTWRTAAVTAFAPTLGLPTDIPISVAPEWIFRPIAQWWKLPAAQRAVAAGRRLIWTDDDLHVYAAETEYLRGPDTLLIGPYGPDGLTPHDLNAIENFLQ